MINSYDALLHMPHPVSKKHPPMTPLHRAAQFSPFAALSGHDAAIAETARLTDIWVEPDESAQAAMNNALRRLLARIAEHPPVRVTYFLPDAKKAGGAYVTISGRAKRLDEWARVLVLTDGTRIPIDAMCMLQAQA